MKKKLCFSWEFFAIMDPMISHHFPDEAKIFRYLNFRAQEVAPKAADVTLKEIAHGRDGIDLGTMLGMNTFPNGIVKKLTNLKDRKFITMTKTNVKDQWKIKIDWDGIATFFADALEKYSRKPEKVKKEFVPGRFFRELVTMHYPDAVTKYDQVDYSLVNKSFNFLGKDNFVNSVKHYVTFVFPNVKYQKPRFPNPRNYYYTCVKSRIEAKNRTGKKSSVHRESEFGTGEVF